MNVEQPFNLQENGPIHDGEFGTPSGEYVNMYPALKYDGFSLKNSVFIEAENSGIDGAVLFQVSVDGEAITAHCNIDVLDFHILERIDGCRLNVRGGRGQTLRANDFRGTQSLDPVEITHSGDRGLNQYIRRAEGNYNQERRIHSNINIFFRFRMIPRMRTAHWITGCTCEG